MVKNDGWAWIYRERNCFMSNVLVSSAHFPTTCYHYHLIPVMASGYWVPTLCTRCTLCTDGQVKIALVRSDNSARCHWAGEISFDTVGARCHWAGEISLDTVGHVTFHSGTNCPVEIHRLLHHGHGHLSSL